MLLKIKIVQIAMFLTVFYSAICDAQAPIVSEINIGGKKIPSPPPILAGEEISLSVTASGQNLQFEWTATDGKLTDSTKSSVIYTAPDLPGVTTVTITVTNIKDQTSVVKSVSFQIVADSPTPITNIPPLLQLFPQVDGGEAFIFKNEDGILTDQYATECAHEGEFGLKLTVMCKHIV